KEVYIKKKQEKTLPPMPDVDTEEASDDSSDGGHGYGYGYGGNSNQNQAGWLPVSSALATDRSRWPGKEGRCEVVGPCVQSSNFPSAYADNDSCEVFFSTYPSYVRVQAFATRDEGSSAYSDRLRVSGKEYKRTQLTEGRGLLVNGNISWRAASSAVGNTTGYGWQVCVTELASCADGLPLEPVPLTECPGVLEFIPSCDFVEPGELCEGMLDMGAEGSPETPICGTRNDLGNCPSRSVYRKSMPTTTSTSIAVTTTPSFEFTDSPVGLWQHAGPCEVRDGCLHSPNFPAAYGVNESCVASVPNFFVVKVVSFATERYEDFLTVSGRSYSGPQWLGPQLVVVHSPIFWHSGSTAADSDRGWELCIEDLPSCADGLALMPVSIPDCPLGAQALPDCQKAAPGEFCEGDGSCGTRTDIDNCYDSSFTHPPTRDVYMKFDGSTLTTTTLTSTGTRTTTQTTSTLPQVLMQTGLWDHSGPCAIDSESGLECVGPPSDKMQSGFECFFEPPNNSIVTVTKISALCDRDGDHLSIDGLHLNKSSSGQLFFPAGIIRYSPHASRRRVYTPRILARLPILGLAPWQICLHWPRCFDGLLLTPIPSEECMSVPDSLPSCLGSAPGELCRAEGEVEAVTGADADGEAGQPRPFLELRAEVSVHLFRQFAAAWLLELMISVFRAPHADISSAMQKVLAAEGFRHVLCDSFANDTQIDDAAFISDSLLSMVDSAGGSIVVIHMPERGFREHNLEALRLLLSGLRQRDLRVVTLSELSRAARRQSQSSDAEQLDHAQGSDG
ncbi:unnamed protein product, partial [Symbiodinium necroappetens]